MKDVFKLTIPILFTSKKFKFFTETKNGVVRIRIIIEFKFLYRFVSKSIVYQIILKITLFMQNISTRYNAICKSYC